MELRIFRGADSADSHGGVRKTKCCTGDSPDLCEAAKVSGANLRRCRRILKNKTPARCRAGVARNYQLQLVIQETFARLRQRMNAAPPASRAAAAQVPGSGTGSGPAPIAVVRRRQPDQGHRSTDGTNPHISPGEICAASKFLWKRNLARPTGQNGKTTVVVPFSDGVNPGRPDDIRLYRPSGRIFHAMHEISGLRHGKL